RQRLHVPVVLLIVFGFRLVDVGPGRWGGTGAVLGAVQTPLAALVLAPVPESGHAALGTTAEDQFVRVVQPVTVGRLPPADGAGGSPLGADACLVAAAALGTCLRPGAVAAAVPAGVVIRVTCLTLLPRFGICTTHGF